MSTDTLLEQSKVIYNVLKFYLSDDDVQDALLMWKNDYSEKSNINSAIDGFLFKMTTHRQVALSIMKIRSALIDRLIQTGSEEEIQQTNVEKGDSLSSVFALKALSENNNLISKNKQSNVDVKKVDVTITMLVFTTLFDSFVKEIKKYSSDSRLEIKEAVFDLNLTTNQWKDIEAFVDGDSRKLAQEYPKDEMTLILNQIYVTACELLGPIQADDCLSAAVLRAERLDVAKVISPRSLL